jgi:hypothetical protein
MADGAEAVSPPRNRLVTPRKPTLRNMNENDDHSVAHNVDDGHDDDASNHDKTNRANNYNSKLTNETCLQMRITRILPGKQLDNIS